MLDALDRFKVALADRYIVEQELGRGGMAVVFLARDLKHDRPIALKVLRPELTPFLGGERFVREIDIAAKLSHPHIVPVFDSGQATGLLYFTMPYVEGESLRARLNREGRLPVEEAQQIAREVAAALSYAHSRGIIHRDIKPENILLSGGEAVVADFGIARAVDAAGGTDLTGSGLPLGTMGYMSPEHAAGSRDLDARSDVYSLGCVLYEMLVGEPPRRVLGRESLTTGRIADASTEERIQLDSLPDPVERILVKALAPRPDDRFTTAEEFAAALTAPTRIVAATPRRRAQRAAVVIVAVLAVVIVASLALRARAGPEPDPNVLAVAPFDVLGTELETWSEGLVDMLSASLDGAGPLRTVSPSVVIKRWTGRADPASATALAADVGAGLVMFGRLVGAGEDSVRLSATLHDVVTDRAVAEFELRGRADHIDRLADSLAVRAMIDLGRTRPLGTWQLSSLGSSSPVALKAFLQGEQHYRRFDLDSAQWYYERAIELDTAFALAYNRRAITLGWSFRGDQDITPSRLRAGALNHRLARRESLQLVVDSIDGAMATFIGDSAGWSLFRRLFATVEYAVREYPLDPYAWYQLGETRYHRGAYVGLTMEETREPFARAVALDSGFVPAYRHLYELTLLLDGPAEAVRLMDANLALADSSVYTDALRVSRAFVELGSAASEQVRDLLDVLAEEGLYQAWYDLKWWPDSAESALRVAQAWVASPDSTTGRTALANSLSFRGRLREAREVLGPDDLIRFASASRLGLVPRDTAVQVFGEALRGRNWFGMYQALPFWLEEGDSLSLREVAGWWDSLTVEGPERLRPTAGNVAGLARSYLAVVRGDTAEALGGLSKVHQWPGCFICYHAAFTRARVLVRLGRDREAATLLDRMPFPADMGPHAEVVGAALERGRVHERLGNRTEAARAYSFVVDAWRNADPELQPVVEEARAALARLTVEFRR